jgi:hypothetical protein
LAGTELTPMLLVPNKYITYLGEFFLKGPACLWGHTHPQALTPPSTLLRLCSHVHDGTQKKAEKFKLTKLKEWMHNGY